MTRFRCGVLFYSACVLLSSSHTLAQDRLPLPVKRVVLYKSGVGYFEHLGQVRDRQDVAVSFTSGQLNDVLKSLTVLDLNGGRITGVEYGSAAPVARQLGDLRLPMGEKTSLTEFLGALRGARVEVRSGTTVIAGRLLSVERKTRISGGTTLEVDYLALMAENGELKTTELSPQFSVRLLEKPLSTRVDRYLDVVAAERDADVRRMVISTDGTGDRSLFVSYISEVPVWKSTYRVVLGKKEPLLQGWAIVDNTVGQDWEKVQLSLVAGAPQSFIQNLSQPFYARRPVVPLPEMAATAPQTYEGTLISGGARVVGEVRDPTGAAVAGAQVRAVGDNGAVLGSAITDSAGRYSLSSLPDGIVRVSAEAQGFKRIETTMMLAAGSSATFSPTMQIGAVSESVSVTASAGLAEPSMAARSGGRSLGSGRGLGSGGGIGSGRGSGYGPGTGGGTGGGAYRVDDARARMAAAASAQDLGDLFEYKLKEPATIQKNRSALVPIVQSNVQADKVSIWNEQSGLPRPQRALWLRNSTGLTLDGGSFSVMEEETFAGEGLFEPIRPDEKRLISYASDLALQVSSRTGNEQQRVVRVIVAKGSIHQYSEMKEKKTYTIRNEDKTPRTLIIEHPVRNGYELRGDAKPVETTAAWMRFQVPVEPKQTAVLEVNEARPMSESHLITDLNSDLLAVFVSRGSVNKEIEAELRKILARKSEVAALSGKSDALEQEMDGIFDDQQRLRENIKSLKGSAEEKALLQRYTKRLNEQEDRLEALKQEKQRIDKEHETAQAALDKLIQDLSFDAKL